MDPRQTADTFNTIQPILFWVVALLTALCAIATVMAQNIVRSATWLLFTLAGTSAVFFLLGADLVGAIQLLVYVGGTLVLVIFGVMLTAQGPFISMKTSGAEWAISIVAGLLLIAVLTTAVMTQTVANGPPQVRTAEVLQAGPNKGQTGFAYKWPEVKRFKPKFSRAERQVESAKPPKVDFKDLPEGGPGPIIMVKKDGPAGLFKGIGGAPQKGPGGILPGGQEELEGPPKKKQPAGQSQPKKKLPPEGQEQPKKEGQPQKKQPPAGGGFGNRGTPKSKGLGGKGGGEGGSSASTFFEHPEPVDPATSAQSATLGQGFIGVGVGPAHPSGKAAIIRTSYLLPFEIVSIHLLVVLIGAAYLARAKRRRGGPQ
jgi:NADH:ubiquinone oxidoreductase subunit 6 (subunit J)